MACKTTKQLARELGLLRKRKVCGVSPKGKKKSKTNQIFSFLIVIDFESTCWENDKNIPQEIIEFPAVLMNCETGEIESTFHHYVLPSENPCLSQFCQQLTGISQTQVDSGIPLSFCLRKFFYWLKKLQTDKGITCVADSHLASLGTDQSSKNKLAAFVTWSDWDLGVCLLNETKRKQIMKPSALDRWIDLRATYRKFYGRRPDGLNGAMKDLGLQFDGREHSGIDDAKNTAHLAHRMMCDGCLFEITKSLKMNSTRMPERKGSAVSNLCQKPGAKHDQVSSVQNCSSVLNQPHRGLNCLPFSIKQDDPDPKQKAHRLSCISKSGDKGLSVRCTNVSSPQRLGKVKEMRKTVPGKSVSIEDVSPVKSASKKNIGCSSPTTRKNSSKLLKSSKCLSNQTAKINPLPLALDSSCSFSSSSSSSSFLTSKPISTISSKNKIPFSNSIPTNPISSVNVCLFPSSAVASLTSTKHSKSSVSSSSSSVSPSSSSSVSPSSSSSSSSSLSHLQTPTSRLTKRPALDKTKSPSTSASEALTTEAFKKPLVPPPPGPNSKTRTAVLSRSTLSAPFKSPASSQPVSNLNRKSNSLLASKASASFTTPISSSTRPSSMKVTPPLCSCGRRSRRRLVQNPGPNVGRWFFSCPTGNRSFSGGDGVYSGCGFFQWEIWK